MPSFDDVRELAATLPGSEEATSRDTLQWRVSGKLFAWERPLRDSDRKHLGGSAPTSPILAVKVPDLGAKGALLADNPKVYFTTPHFEGYAIVLVLLDVVDAEELAELLVESWLVAAPKRLARTFLDNRPTP